MRHWRGPGRAMCWRARLSVIWRRVLIRLTRRSRRPIFTATRATWQRSLSGRRPASSPAMWLCPSPMRSAPSKPRNKYRMNSALSTSTKRLIVNADDYGLTPGVSRGILEAHLKGIVTSTSVMMGLPGVAEAIQEAQRSAPKLGMGVHLTLTGAAIRPVLPVAEVSSLVQPDGTFYHLRDWMARFAEFDADQIAREMTAQVEHFTRIVGHPPDHLDAHHHIAYRHPAALQTLFSLAARYHIPVRNVGFGSEAATNAVLASSLRELPPGLQQSTIKSIHAVLDSGTPPWPERFEDGYYDVAAPLGDLLLILANLPGGVITELMCHPGYSSDDLDSDYAKPREGELAALTHASTRELVEAEGIMLVTFGAVIAH